MDADSFIFFTKINDIYRDNAKDVEARFHTSNYELGRSLPRGKNKKVIQFIKDEFSRGANVVFSRSIGNLC